LKNNHGEVNAMAFLDFINNRQGQRPAAEQQSQQQSQQQKPETTREMNVPQSQKSVAQIPDSEKSKARELGARIDTLAQNAQQKAPAQTQAPEGGASGPEPQRQMMTGQDKAAPALSPTSAQRGTPATEKDAPAPSQDTSSQSTERSQEQTRQTIARRPPSWER
jgi:hypothetical protein